MYLYDGILIIKKKHHCKQIVKLTDHFVKENYAQKDKHSVCSVSCLSRRQLEEKNLDVPNVKKWWNLELMNTLLKLICLLSVSGDHIKPYKHVQFVILKWDLC